MDRAKRRSRKYILAQILNFCMNGAIKTKIVYQLNLNFKTADIYLGILIGKGFITAVEEESTTQATTTKSKKVLYKTTESGLLQLNNFNTTLKQIGMEIIQ